MTKIILFDLSDIYAVVTDLSALNIIETVDQIGDCRLSLGIVLQDTHLFTGTVMENIRYGKLDATEEEVHAAAKLANADGFEHLVCCDDEHYPVLSSCLNHIDSISSSFPKGYRLAIKGALFTFFYTIFTNSTDIPAPKNDPHIERRYEERYEEKRYPLQI